MSTRLSRLDKVLDILNCILMGWVFIYCVVCALCILCSCQSVPQVHTSSIREQHLMAVEIQGLCFDEKVTTIGLLGGSGVLLDDHTVLTAGHVTVAPDGMTCMYTGKLLTGESVMLTVGTVDTARDLATMTTLTGSFHGALPVDIGPRPELGAEVCYVSSMPMHMRRCGQAQPTHPPPGDLPLDVIVEQGNSGSPAYDAYGRLVGIVVHAGMCQNGQYCSSEISSIDPDELRFLRTGFR